MDYSIVLNSVHNNISNPLHVFYPKTVEDKFISKEISDSVLMILRKMNIINTMFFKSWIYDTSIVITASLPNVYWKNRATEDLIYYNKIAFLNYNINSFKLTSLVSAFSIPDSSYTLEHLSTSLINFKNKVYYCIPIVKGWPVVGSSSFDKEDSINNPFIKSFYENSYSVAVFDSKGKFVTYFNTIDKIYSKNHLGYYFSTPIIKTLNKTIVVAESSTGKISYYHNFSDVEPFKSINTIDISNYKSSLDYNTYPLNYLNDYKLILNTFLLDFYVDNKTILAVYKNNNLFFYKVFNQNGKVLYEKYLPNNYHNLDLKNVKITWLHGKPVIAAQYYGNDNFKLLLFEVKN